MEIKRKININLRKTVENAVCRSDDFHFFVDELTSDNLMPTYAGRADEKYSFDEMDDDFFEFLMRKAAQDGLYIRLVHAKGERTKFGYKIDLECGCNRCSFETTDSSDAHVFDFADFGIRVLNDEITFGTTVDGDCISTPYFAEFNSRDELSADDPFNRFVLRILDDMIVADE